MHYIIDQEDPLILKSFFNIKSFLTQKDFEQQFEYFFTNGHKRGRSQEIDFFTDLYMKITEFQKISEQKNVISTADQNATAKIKSGKLEITFDDLKRSFGDSDEISYANFIKKTPVLEFRKCPVTPLKYHVNKSLRKFAIKTWYKTLVYKKLDQANVSTFDNYTSVHAKSMGTNFPPIMYGYGYISSYRPKLLISFKSQNVYWIRLKNNEQMTDFVNESITKSSDTFIEFGKKFENNIPVIDIITTDRMTKHLFSFITNKENIGFIADLGPLINLLNKTNLLDAV